MRRPRNTSTSAASLMLACFSSPVRLSLLICNGQLACALDTDANGRDELGIGNRLGEEIIGTTVQRLDLRAKVGFGREVNNGQAGPVFVLPDHAPPSQGLRNSAYADPSNNSSGRKADIFSMMASGWCSTSASSGAQQDQTIMRRQLDIVVDNQYPLRGSMALLENMRHPVQQTRHVQGLRKYPSAPNRAALTRDWKSSSEEMNSKGQASFCRFGRCFKISVAFSPPART